MKVRELMSSPACSCRPTDSLARAAQLLWDHDCGMLPVVDQSGRVTSAITDRDICMAALSRGRTLADLRVMDSMSRKVVTCKPDDELPDAVHRMMESQVRRLPVVDADGKPRGVLSLNDLALAGESDLGMARESQRVLVAACRRRASVPANVAAVATAGMPQAPAQRANASRI